jgi:2,4-dienoyl-CoA reductase-like NADH-dependent reductase (Old Yellow Enzyme family)
MPRTSHCIITINYEAHVRSPREEIPMTTGSSREDYRLFSPLSVGPLQLPNRLARSATWDPTMVFSRQVDNTTLDTYRRLAGGASG